MASRSAMSSRSSAYIAIQAVESACSRYPSDGGSVGPVERGDVVQAHEAALEQVVPAVVLVVDPPGEVDQQLVEDPGQEGEVGAAVDLEHPQRRPGVHRRVDVGEVPLVGRDLPVRVHVPLAQQQHELRLGERRVDVRDRHAVEGQVPGREPRVLPRVGHQDDLVVVQVRPVAVADVRRGRAAVAAGRDRRPASASRRSGRTACPTAARRTPAARPAPPRPGRCAGITDGVERVGLRLAGRDHRVEPVPEVDRRARSAPAGRRPAPGAGRRPAGP